MAGGHSVPVDKIISRYVRSMANLSGAIQLADRVYVYDNSVENAQAQLCTRTQDGAIRKVYIDLPTLVADAVAALPQHADYVDARVA